MPSDLGERGQRLWDALHGLDNAVFDPAQEVLVEEACRIVDRLDRLHAYLSGDEAEWLRVVWDTKGRELVLELDDALAETRQQANTLRQIVGDLKLPKQKAKAAGSALDELRAKRERRRSG